MNKAKSEFSPCLSPFQLLFFFDIFVLFKIPEDYHHRKEITNHRHLFIYSICIAIHRKPMTLGSEQSYNEIN